MKTTLPMGKGVDANAFDPATGLSFSSNGDGTLTVIHEDSPAQFSVVSNVTTQPGARTLVLDLKTHNVFLAAAKFAPLPAAVLGQPSVRRPIVPGTFTLLLFSR